MSSTAMFGGTYGYSIGRWTFDARLLGGFYFAKAPNVRIDGEGAIPEEARKFNNLKYDCVGTFGWQTGICVRYNFCKRWFFNARSNFYHARPQYKIDYQEITPKYGYQSREYVFSQCTSVADITFGIGLDLGKIRK
jgi:hypothetical protein